MTRCGLICVSIRHLQAVMAKYLNMKNYHLFFLVLFFNINSQAEIISIKCPDTNNENKRWSLVLNTDDFNNANIYAEYAEVENEVLIDLQYVKLKITPRFIIFDISLKLNSQIKINKTINRVSLQGVTGSSVNQCEMTEIPNINKF